MSNEIRVNLAADVSHTSNAIRWQWKPSTINVDMTSTAASGGIQIIGNSAEAISLGSDISTAGMAVFQHVGTSGYIDIVAGVSNATHYFARLYSNQACITFLQNTTLGAVASITNAPLYWQVFAR